MTVKWVTTPKERLGRKYRELHKQLAKEVADNRAALCGITDLMRGETTKHARKRQNSQSFRARGE